MTGPGKEGLTPISRLTPKERKWIADYQFHETPDSLRVTDKLTDPLVPNEIILEVGCAFGRVANILSAKRRVFVIGVDTNRAEIRWAKRLTSRINERINFQEMNGKELTFP